VLQVTDGNSQQVSFSYPQDFLTVFTNARNYQTSYYWDNYYRTTDVVNAASGHHHYTYDLANNSDHTLAYQDANGVVTYFSYSALGLATGISKTVTVNGTPQVYSSGVAYNSQNQPQTITDTRQFVTHISYDTATGNLPVTITDPLSSYITYQYNDAAHPARVTDKSTSNSMSVHYDYDSNGFFLKTTRTFNTLKNSGSTPTQPVAVSLATNYSFDSIGRLTDRSDNYDIANQPNPLPKVHYAYDTASHTLTTTNQLNEQTSNQYDLVGNVVTNTNYLGQHEFYGYDNLNRLTSSTHGLNPGIYANNLVTTYAYDANSNLQSTTVQTTPQYVTATYGYDNIDRVISATTPLRTGSAVQTLYNYDNLNNILGMTTVNNQNGGSGNQVTSYAYDEMYRLINSTDAGGYTTHNTYDPANNLALRQRSKGIGANVTNWNDPSQVVTSATTYDALSRPLYQTANAWNGTTSQALVVTTTYSDTQNSYSASDPTGITTIFQSDAAGRAISTTIVPTTTTQTQQTSYQFYDPRDLAVHSIDAANDYYETGYDLVGRVVNNTAYTGVAGTGTALTTSTYYTDTTLPHITTIGPAPNYVHQDLYFDDANRSLGSIVYTDTIAGSLNPSVQPHGALTSCYLYDEQNNLRYMFAPNGQKTEYQYESTGWPLQTTLHSSIATSAYTCGLGGGSANSMAKSKALAAPTPDTLTTNYQYDLVGNLVGRTDANQHVITNTYDTLNRLVMAQDGSGYAHTTQYDGLNRVTVSSDAKNQNTSYTYDNASRVLQVATAGNITTTYTYNNDGAVMTMQDKIGSSSTISTTYYNYDGFDRLNQVNNYEQVVNYGYDNLNRRTSMSFSPSSSGFKTVRYGYDGLSRPLTETNWLAQTSIYKYKGERLDQQQYPNAPQPAIIMMGLIA
jgi:YD repeat-containing protein